MAAAQDIHEYLKGLAAGAARAESPAGESLTELLGQTALLELMARGPHDGSGDRALLYIMPLDPGATFDALHPKRYFQAVYRHVFRERLGMEITTYPAGLPAPLEFGLIEVRGAHALTFATAPCASRTSWTWCGPAASAPPTAWPRSSCRTSSAAS
jgi:hypothetical protein